MTVDQLAHVTSAVQVLLSSFVYSLLPGEFSSVQVI